MNDREEQLRRDATAMAEAIDRELQVAFRPVAEHAERVRDVSQELTLVADRATQRAEALRDDEFADRGAVAELVAMAEILRSLSGEMHVMAQRSVQDLEQLKGRLTQSVRATALGNRRRYERFEVDVPVEASFSGRRELARVVNLSLGGAKMDLAINRAVGTTVALRVAGLTHELAGEVVRVTEDGTQLRFTIGDNAADELRRFLERIGSTKPGQG
ncbi:MAG: PilZ domain-containing protein [Rhodospirillaceae bacterium]|nr:PilZ domain-containing protein [Rhodospirillaceae bacterium]